MTGFFLKLRNGLKDSHSGRYLSMLLRELAFGDPDTFARIFLPRDRLKALKNGGLQIEAEWGYPGALGGRFADLAVLAGGEPLVLVEVKEDDVNSAANPAQLADYIDYVRAHPGCRFFHLSRYSPTKLHTQAIRAATAQFLAVKSMRYRDLYAALRESPREFSRLLVDYLEDIGVASYQVLDIDDNKVRFFLVHSLGFKYNTGLGRLYSNGAVGELPAIVKTMFDNMEALAEWIRDSNPDAIGQRFSRKYRPEPVFDLKALAGALAKQEEEVGMLPGRPGRFVQSGAMQFSALGKIKSQKWLYVEVRMGLVIDAAAAKPVTLSLSAAFYGDGVETEWETKQLTHFPTEAKAHKHFSRLIDKAREAALAEDAKGLHAAALKSFKVPS